MSLRLRLIITTWALVSGCYGQSDVINRRCCVPSHFRCTMDVTGGYTDPVSGTTSYVDRKVRLYNDYDLNATRTDTDVTLPSGVTFVHSELTFYDKHISYKIDGGKCRTDHITDAMQDKCIPGIRAISLKYHAEGTQHSIQPGHIILTTGGQFVAITLHAKPDAVLLRTSRIGQTGHDGINVDTWRYITSDNITILRTVTSNECWPVYQTEYSVHKGGYSEMTYMISDIELGKFPGLILTPNICIKT